MHEFIQKLNKEIVSFLIEKFSLSKAQAIDTGEILILILFFFCCYVFYKLTLFLVRRIFIPLLNKSKNKFDDILLKNSFFKRIAYLVPILLTNKYLEEVIPHYPSLSKLLLTISEVLFVYIFILILKSILDSINDYYNRFSFAKDHPIKGVIQITQMIIYLIGSIVVIGIVFDKEIDTLVLSLGTLSAVLMLIFKDPILGLVGGMQLVFNKMLSIGDWISMPKYGADGAVLEINLTTVKVQNWDKTIVTLPTYSMISDSFQNWRGMQECGGRRIKRSVYINMKSIKFCDQEMLDRFKEIDLIKDYVEETEKEANEFNTSHKVNPNEIVNGRRQTNIGVFRAYLKAYLRAREDINQDLTFMVRQLEPNEKGLPIEIYVFANTVEWVIYEGTQSDIFDHVLASIPEFGLEVYQYISDGSHQ